MTPTSMVTLYPQLQPQFVPSISTHTLKASINAFMCYLDRFVRKVDKSPKSGIAQTLRCMLSPVGQ